MSLLTVYEVLLTYGEPQLILAKSSVNSLYVGINYEDGVEHGRFFFSKVDAKNLALFLQQKIDLRYLITKHAQGRYELGELWGAIGDTVETVSVTSIAPEMLPQPGLFIRYESMGIAANQVRTVNIDGRWGIDDLSRFSDLVQDAYALTYGLLDLASACTASTISSLFHRYPWRGGISSVNFFDSLYKAIPSSDRAAVKGIQYASPGIISLSMRQEVAEKIANIVTGINSDDSSVRDAYKSVHDWLRERNWLRSSQSDFNLTDADVHQLQGRLTFLMDALGLSEQRAHIFDLASSDPLSAVKILLAYYRRLAALADYSATGKAANLFALPSA